MIGGDSCLCWHTDGAHGSPFQTASTGARVNSATLWVQQLNRAFVTAAAHVELFVRDGWLIHLALMSDVKGHFEDLHALILDILENSVPEDMLGDVMQHKRRCAAKSETEE
jgi:hypothetical protein